MDPVEVSVDLDRCVGSQLCLWTAPNVFALDANGQSTVADAGGDSAAQILEAAEQCPTEAITVTDAATGNILFP